MRERLPTANTRPHQQLHALLVGLGYEVEDEVPVGRYRLDCYVRELHLGFEADGPQHRAKRDEARDLWIEARACVPVFRARWQVLASSTRRDRVKEEVRQFAASWAPSAEVRRAAAEVRV